MKEDTVVEKKSCKPHSSFYFTKERELDFFVLKKYNSGSSINQHYTGRYQHTGRKETEVGHVKKLMDISYEKKQI